MKNFLLIVFILGFQIILRPIYTQTIVQSLNADNRINKDIEMLLEIKETINKIQDSLSIDFNHSDTLYVARNQSIESRQGYGYLWNSRIKIQYSDNKKYKYHKLINTDPKIEIKNANISWYEFDDLIPAIEKWDTIAIKNYVDKSDKGFDGGFGWYIFKCIKSDKGYYINLLYVRDFMNFKKYKNTGR